MPAANSERLGPALNVGPANENADLSFTVTNSNNALFSSQPAVSGNGTLSYTPAANANGAATVTLYVRTARTANGGVDTSATRRST
jgi:hypothetical protein